MMNIKNSGLEFAGIFFENLKFVDVFDDNLEIGSLLLYKSVEMSREHNVFYS